MVEVAGEYNKSKNNHSDSRGPSKDGEGVKYGMHSFQKIAKLTGDVVEKTVLAEERLSKSDDDSRPGALDWTEEEEAILRHKMDWRTVPWVTVLYLLCVRRLCDSIEAISE